MQRRQLNLFDAVMLVMGGVIGVGIFFTPARVAALVPDAATFFGMWVLGGVVALSGAVTFAELGGSFPVAGGWYVFLREAWGRFVAFLFAWVVLGVIATGATAVMAGFCLQSLGEFAPALRENPHMAKVATAALIFAVHVLAMFGVRAGAKLQNACMVLKLAAVAVLAAGAFFFFDPPPELATAAPAATRAFDLATLGAALLPVLFACGGWQHLCCLASEVENPQRTLPLAMLLGACGIVLVYLLANGAFVHVLGTAGMANDQGFAQRVADLTLGSAGGKFLAAAMAISALGVTLVTVLATPWLFVAMAREGLFFARFADVHPVSGAPVPALIVQLVLCLTWCFGGRAEQLVDATVAAEWIFHALAAGALLRLRALRPELDRPFKSPLYPLAPLVYLAIALFVVVSNFQGAQLEHTGTGLLVLLLGAAVYVPWRAIVARSTPPG